MFRVEGADEHGRNDVAKLGFFLVKVHEHGHVNELVRTFGACLGPGEPDLEPTRRVRAPSVKQRWSVPVGVDLRHSWAERTEIPPSGSLDEFERKIARNDYPLMALWEMGARRLRLPLHDAEDHCTLERMAILRDMGHQLTFYVHGPLSPAREDALSKVNGLADGVELIMRLDDAETLRRSVGVAREKAKTSVFVSRLWSSGRLREEGRALLPLHQTRFLRRAMQRTSKRSRGRSQPASLPTGSSFAFVEAFAPGKRCGICAAPASISGWRPAFTCS